MKLTIPAAVLFAACISTTNTAIAVPSTTDALVSLASSEGASFEAQNRKGSKRIGGTGRSGKGGRYVGGRRR